MSTNYDAIVIGAGMIGTACARALSGEGMKLAIIEPGVIAGGASGAGMGHIVVMDDSAAQFALTAYSRSLWRFLCPELPGNVEYRECGTIWVAADDEEMAALEGKRAAYLEQDVRAEILSKDELHRLEPFLRSNLAGGMLVLEDGVIYAPAACRFFLDAAINRGAEMYSDRVLRAGAGTVVLESGRELTSERIVNATGEWADKLTRGIQTKRRKGHLAITDRYPGIIEHQLLELGYLKSAHSNTADSVAFNLQPRATGQVLIGSSRQYDSDSKDVDTRILSAMLRRAIEYVPGLANKSVTRVWTGFRAATPDKLPLIGPWHEDSTIYLATGHEGLGITTSLGTAALLADYFAGRKPAVSLEPYLPQRQKSPVIHA